MIGCRCPYHRTIYPYAAPSLKALEPVFTRRIERRDLLTRIDRQRKMSFDIRQRLRKQFGAELCETVISKNAAIAAAPALNLDIFGHNPASRGAQDYLALRNECGPHDSTDDTRGTAEP